MSNLDPVECAICGDYTVADLQVHEFCLSRALAAPTLDRERLARAIENHSHVGAPPEQVIACSRGEVSSCAPAIADAYEAPA